MIKPRLELCHAVISAALAAIVQIGCVSVPERTVEGKTGTDIQRAIDEMAVRGGGRVVVPPGEYRVGSLRLRSKVELHLEEGAVLSGGTRSADYFSFPDEVCPIRPERSGRVLLYAWDERDIAVTGKGVNGVRQKDGEVPGVYAESRPLERPGNCLW